MKDGKKLSWFKIMWENHYLQLFSIFVSGLIGIICSVNAFNSLAGFYFMCGIMVAGMLLIGYLGFYKFWKELKQLEKEGKL